MAVLPAIFRRDDSANGDATLQSDDSTGTYSPKVATLVTVLVCLMLTSVIGTAVLFYLRQRRRRAALLRLEATLSGSNSIDSSMGMQKNMGLRAPAKPSHHRRTKSLTTPPDSPIFAVGSDGGSLLDEKRMEAHGALLPAHHGIPTVTIPQIHLTFPEELDEKTGRRESKVVVVTVSEKGAVGLAPFEEESAPPAYRERDEMKSLDLERIGGLKEKN